MEPTAEPDAQVFGVVSLHDCHAVLDSTSALDVWTSVAPHDQDSLDRCVLPNRLRLVGGGGCLGSCFDVGDAVAYLGAAEGLPHQWLQDPDW